jgi:hypothetical protein
MAGVLPLLWFAYVLGAGLGMRVGLVVRVEEELASVARFIFEEPFVRAWSGWE